MTMRRQAGSMAMAVALLALGGCASLYTGKVPASHGTFEPSRREQVWTAALDELRARSFELETVDPVQGVIRTRRTIRPGRVPCGFVTCRFRDIVEVRIAPDATVVVEVKRELASLMLWTGTTLLFVDEEWSAPSKWQKETLAGIAADQDELVRAVTR